jgi:hypothetical protein
MAPKAAEEKDPAAAAAAAVTVAIDSLQSDDPAVRDEALQSLASLCASAWGESDVHDALGVIMPTLLRLLEMDEPALHFAAKLAQLPWGTEALLLQGALPPLLRLTLPPPPPAAPPPPPPDEELEEEEPDEDQPVAPPAEPIEPAEPAEPPAGWAHAGLACAVIGGIATFAQGRHELCACGAPALLLALIAPPEIPAGVSPALYTAPIVPLELQAEAALVLTRCAEAAAARSQLLASGGVPRLVRRLQLHVPLLDEPAPATAADGWAAALRSRLLLMLGMVAAYDYLTLTPALTLTLA